MYTEGKDLKNKLNQFFIKCIKNIIKNNEEICVTHSDNHNSEFRNIFSLPKTSLFTDNNNTLKNATEINQDIQTMDCVIFWY